MDFVDAISVCCSTILVMCPGDVYHGFRWFWRNRKGAGLFIHVLIILDCLLTCISLLPLAIRDSLHVASKLYAPQHKTCVTVAAICLPHEDIQPILGF